MNAAISVVVCVLLLLAGTEGYDEVRTYDTRLEEDYDYTGAGRSFYLRTLYEGEHVNVCWENYWADFDFEDTTRWCEQYAMRFGSTYTGTDEPGEISMELFCGPGDDTPNDCLVGRFQPMNCTFHVRVQCMRTMSKFAQMYPLSGILVAVIGGLFALCVISWLGCCYMAKSSARSAKTSPEPEKNPQMLGVCANPAPPPYYVA